MLGKKNEKKTHLQRAARRKRVSRDKEDNFAGKTRIIKVRSFPEVKKVERRERLKTLLNVCDVPDLDQERMKCLRVVKHWKRVIGVRMLCIVTCEVDLNGDKATRRVFCLIYVNHRTTRERGKSELHR